MTKTFEAALRDALTKLHMDLPHELWALISWLEERGQRFETPAGLPFLAIADAAHRDELWSHIYFDLPPDLVRFWFGSDGLEKQITPFVHCGSDGSYIALWRHKGAPDRYVFLGSEGEAFTLAETPRAFITLLTMGYPWIEMRQDLTAPPEQLWEDAHDLPWPGLVAVKDWASAQFDLKYPMTGSTILPYSATDDPFIAFVAEAVGH